jgi:hypothetical protein
LDLPPAAPFQHRNNSLEHKLAREQSRDRADSQHRTDEEDVHVFKIHLGRADRNAEFD